METPQKRCFVVMGFGIKTDFATGRKLDLNKSYRLLIKPVVEEKGLVCVRADEIQHSVVMSKKKDGSFSCELSLPKGSQHQFKYRVNETLWINEPEADSTQPNEFGGINSVLVL